MPRNLNQIPKSTDEVYKDLLDKIVTLKFEPGRRISENQICMEYHVSRSVIRTAFTRLKEQKLVEIYPQRGTYVSLIDMNYVNNMLYLRAALEKEVLSNVMKLDNEKKYNLIIALQDNIDQQRSLYNSTNCKNYTEAYKMLDEKFHDLLMSSVNRDGLLEIMKQPLFHVSRWRNFDVNCTQRLPELIDQHNAILQAIKENNLVKAQDCIRIHLNSILNISAETFQLYHQYFK